MNVPYVKEQCRNTSEFIRIEIYAYDVFVRALANSLKTTHTHMYDL